MSKYVSSDLLMNENKNLSYHNSSYGIWELLKPSSLNKLTKTFQFICGHKKLLVITSPAKISSFNFQIICKHSHNIPYIKILMKFITTCNQQIKFPHNLPMQNPNEILNEKKEIWIKNTLSSRFFKFKKMCVTLFVVFCIFSVILTNINMYFGKCFLSTFVICENGNSHLAVEPENLQHVMKMLIIILWWGTEREFWGHSISVLMLFSLELSKLLPFFGRGANP